MIARLWKGCSAPETVGAHEEHLRGSTFPELSRNNGREGAFLLSRDPGPEIELLVSTLWNSLEAVDAFAGPDRARAVVPPAARQALARFEEPVAHFEVVLESAPLRS